MMPAHVADQAPVPPPAYHRVRQRVGPCLHLNALTLITRLHLLALCGLAVRFARWRCPPSLPAGPGGRPQVYQEESLLLLALLRVLWHLSYQDVHDWLVAWPALRGRVACPAMPRATLRSPALPSSASAARGPGRRWARRYWWSSSVWRCTGA